MTGKTVDGVKAIMADRLHVDVADEDVDLIGSGLLDSMTLVELFVALEEEFGIDVADEDLDLEDFRTVTAISRFVERHVTASP